MATAKFLRSVRPLASSSATSASPAVGSVRCSMPSPANDGRKLVITSGDGEGRKTSVALKATTMTTTSETIETSKLEDLQFLSPLVKFIDGIIIPLSNLARKKIQKLQIQMSIEKSIIDCRFFTLFAVAGSLMGSILCYLEGSFMVMESYFQYFQALSQKSDQDGHVVELLVEAIDMFLVGTALVVFGVGMYAIFVGSKTKKKAPSFSGSSNLFGLFYVKKLPTWVDIESVSEAKSKIGHAVMMILQVGVVEKFKSIPMITAGDLACFAGAVLISSASVFLLSKLNVGGGAGHK